MRSGGDCRIGMLFKNRCRYSRGSRLNNSPGHEATRRKPPLGGIAQPREKVGRAVLCAPFRIPKSARTGVATSLQCVVAKLAPPSRSVPGVVFNRLSRLPDRRLLPSLVQSQAKPVPLFPRIDIGEGV